MSVKITYKNKISNNNAFNLVLFVDEKFNISNVRKYISSSEYLFISDMVKIKNPKKI